MTVTVTDGDDMSGDGTPPVLVAFERHNPAAAQSTADRLTWRLRFSEPVQGVEPAVFSITGTTANLSVEQDGDDASAWLVTASGGNLGNLEGDVTLGFRKIFDSLDKRIRDFGGLQGGNPFGGATRPGVADTSTYEVDTIHPTVKITGVPDPITLPFTATLTFSEPVTGFRLDHIRFTKLGFLADIASFSNLVEVEEGTVYTALITPTTQTTSDIRVRLLLFSARVKDKFGNLNQNTKAGTGIVESTFAPVPAASFALAASSAFEDEGAWQCENRRPLPVSR